MANPRGVSIGIRAPKPRLSRKIADIRNFLASIVDSSDDAILSKDLNGYILSWNQSAQRLYGYTAEEIIGRHVSILAPPEIPEDIPTIMERLNRGEKIDHYETVRITKDGQRLNISLTVSPIRDSSGRLIAASAIARDITDRKQAEMERARLLDELQRSLAQKNILLQEVYHRVKNNLQVICSLLDLRSKYVMKHPEKAGFAFSESIQRIRAISLVHEKLYQTPNLEELDFAVYARALIEQVIRAFALNKRIEFNLEGDAVQLGLNNAIPLGLILNELVTNSLKYAFASSSEGLIEVHCTDNLDSIRITYSDSGPGFDPNIFGTSDSFGFRIVALLTQQLNGEIVVREKINQTIFELTIPKQQS